MGDMDTEAQLDMSLGDIIKRSKTQASTITRAPLAGGGKIRPSGGRVERRQVSAPYSKPVISPRSSTFSGALTNRVYVGNLAYSVTWKELKDHMRQAGNVIKADVPITSGGRSRGFGLVEFATEADARNAIETLQDTDLMGRPILMREDREAPGFATGGGGGVAGGGGPRAFANGGGGGGGGGGCKVYVGNLLYEVSWQTLKDHMRQAGNVIRAEIMEDATGRSKGYGTVEYSKPFEARNAIAQLNESLLQGRPIMVREDRQDSNPKTVISRGVPAGGRGGVGNGFVGRATAAVTSPRVYVGNLAWETTWQQLKDFMRQAGNVKFADIFQQQPGNPGGRVRSLGCATVEYETVDEAANAIRMLHDQELQGRLIFVREDREKGTGPGGSGPSRNTVRMGGGGMGGGGTGIQSGQVFGDPERQIYVGNLSWQATWQDVKDHFKHVGVVQFVDIPQDGQGRSRGYATVRFAQPDDAQRAVRELNESDLLGRRVLVREDREAMH